jgi:EmrB/QacA subfamily drug resistance transporter
MLQPAGVVCGTDGSDSANESVRQAAALAESLGGTLHIVTAYSDTGARTSAETTARRVAAGLSGVAEVHAVQADPADALRQVAHRTGAELIVVGNRDLDQGPRGSIADQLQRRSPCAVIVVDTEPYWRAVEIQSSSPVEDRREPRLGAEAAVLLVATLAVFMAFLDVTIVNIAFTAIHRTFHTVTIADLSWVINAYNVVVAALLVPAGRLADRFGRRRMFFTGLGVFLAGSALCGAAPTAAVLVAARVLQASGAAMLIPSSLGLVLHEFPPARRAFATSVWAAAGAVAAATGPSLGGVLVQSTSWRWAFYLNFPVALALLPLSRRLRESRDSEAREAPDMFGAALLAGAVGALALGIVKAPDWGWTSIRVIASWCAALLLLATLRRRSVSHPAPVLERAMLSIDSFRLAICGFFVFSTGMFALLLGNIMFLTQVWHYSLLQAGFGVTPGPLFAAAAAGAGGRLTQRVGPRAVALPALLLFAVACLIYRGAGPTPDYLGDWLPAQVLSGTSIGLVFAGLTTASVMDLPPNRLATGTALESCFRQVGAVLGIAGLIAIVGTPAPQAAMHAFEHAWLLMAVTALAAAGLAARLPHRRPGEGPLPEPLHPRRAPVEVAGMARREFTWGGQRVVFRTAGSGPALLLIHGLLEDSKTWRRIAPALAIGHTVIAPDLLGHGESDAPLRFDYSPGGHCAMLRALLDELGHRRVTIVGHSLGGGIALAFTSLFPERVERLALISPGGLGCDVHPLLRGIALPGVSSILRAVSARPLRAALRGIGALLRHVGARAQARVLREVARMLETLAEAGTRTGFMRSGRAVISWRGVHACALGFIDALERIPLLMMWGTADRAIPIAHGYAALERYPHAELVALEGVGHLPHLTQPAFVAGRIAEFLVATQSPAASPVTPAVFGRGHPRPQHPVPVPIRA